MTGNNEIRKGALLTLHKLREKKESLEFRLIPKDDRTLDEWLDASWSLELELTERSIDTLENMIIENEFDF